MTTPSGPDEPTPDGVHDADGGLDEPRDDAGHEGSVEMAELKDLLRNEPVHIDANDREQRIEIALAAAAPAEERPPVETSPGVRTPSDIEDPSPIEKVTPLRPAAPGAAPAPRRGSRWARPVVAAAAVLVVLGIGAAGWAGVRGSDGEQMASSGADSATESVADPAALPSTTAAGSSVATAETEAGDRGLEPSTDSANEVAPPAIDLGVFPTLPELVDAVERQKGTAAAAPPATAPESIVPGAVGAACATSPIARGATLVAVATVADRRVLVYRTAGVDAFVDAATCEVLTR